MSVFDQGIEDDQQLSHTGDVDDEIRFSGRFESIGKGFEDGVASSRGQCRHIESGPDIGTSSGDASASLEFGTVMVVGRESRECGDFGAIGGAQLGDFREELVCGGLSDARHAAENLAFGFPVLVGFEQLCEGEFDEGDLFVEQRDGRLNAFLRNLAMRHGLSVCLDGADLDELSATGDEILQFALIVRGFRGGSGMHDLCEMSQVFGIKGVGLGPMSESFSEVSGLSGIDDSDGNLRLDQMADEAPLISPRGFDDDQPERRELSQFLDEPVVALGVVVPSPSLGQGSDVNVELVFGDINPNPDWNGNG